ncbi:MAG: 3-deoxy-8-phosphooctulonate synthase [Endomicrobiales bacterium]|nr:3-deoxy-8-phosphooctulonate synthase [Endomicrobiales bacterium]
MKGFNVKFSNERPLVLVAGPCVIENEKSTLELARKLKIIAKKLNVPLVFKASYDKANRSSVRSFRGPGILGGLKVLARVKKELKIPVLTDVHSVSDVELAAETCDVLQIPAFLCRQTDLIVAAARTGLCVNVKKGQFLAPEDVGNIAGKIRSAGNNTILFTERGTSFGYHNLVVDMRSIPVMKEAGYPVVFDATHSVQLPSGKGSSSGGQKEFVLPLSKAAVSLGISALFVEVHKNPKKALSDGSNSLSLSELPCFLDTIIRLDRFIKKL